MATISDNPRMTFIHIPKCAGNSITIWMKKNLNAKITKGKQHATVYQTKVGTKHKLGPIKDLGFTFCIVRNPYDYLVSWYEFRRRLCIQYIEYLEKNPGLVDSRKKRFNLQGHKQRLDRLNNIGFEEWVKSHHIKQQHYWANDCDYVMKLENINEDFKIIQNKTGIFEPLPHNNAGGIRKKDYKSYYTKQETIDYVANKFSNDLTFYNYKFS